MRSIVLPLLSTGLLCGAATAQVGPGIIKGETESKVFNISYKAIKDLTVSEIQAISHYRTVGLKPSEATTCLTVKGLASSHGGNGTNVGILMGVHDLKADTFVANKKAAKLNSAGDDFGLHVGDPATPILARIAVLDWPAGPQISDLRDTTGSDYPSPSAISGFGSTTYVDPSLGKYDGKFWLFYVAGGGSSIDMAELVKDSTTKKWSVNLTKGIQVVVPSVTGNLVHSPSPVIGKDGDVEGLFYAERTGTDSDMYFKSGLDKATKGGLVNDQTYWQNNGGYFGGTFYWGDARSTPSAYYAAVYTANTTWMVGDSEKAGGTIDLTAGCWSGATTGPVTVLLVSGGLLSTPVTVPGILGKYGLDLTTLVTGLGVIAHSPLNHEGSISLPIPSSLSPATIYMQGLSVTNDGTKAVFAFTNTGSFSIK
jgi:hypothetical protein